MPTEEKRPPIAAILWLEAVRLTANGELPIDDEERQMLPIALRDRESDSPFTRPIFQEWTEIIDHETSYLSDGLDIKAWVSDYEDANTESAVIIHHDAPEHTDPYKAYPTSVLTPNNEEVVRKHLNHGTAIYEVRLHIKWSVTDGCDAKEQKETKSFFLIDGTTLRRCIVKTPHVEIPFGITHIADRCFSNGDGTVKGQETLRSVDIPSSVVSIGESAFAHSPNLEKVKIMGPADISTCAFFECEKLNDVYLADGVKSLGRNSFGHTPSLKSLFIPLSVKYIDRFMALQENEDTATPELCCARGDKAPKWDLEWNLYYTHHDPEMGYTTNLYHPVHFNSKRQ